MSWQQSTLGEECELYQPQTLAKNELDNSGVYKVYGANGVIGTHSKYNHEHPQLLVTCRGATCGTINISEAKSWINGNAMVVKPRSANVDLYFLSHYLHHLDISKAITGAAQPQITRQSLAPIKIQFPPLAQQQRIAAILDKAAGIKAKRELAIAKLDNLALSKYAEMFGAESNFDGDETTLGSCLKLINGRAYLQHELLDEGTPIIRIQNLNGGNRWYYSNLDLPAEKYCNDGDLLFAWSATFGPYIWKGSKSIYHYHIWKIQPTDLIDKTFAYYLLLSITREIKNASHGASMLHMTKSGMEAWPIRLPKLEAQKRFVELIKKQENLMNSMQNSLSVIHRKIASLQHQAFTTGFNA